MQRGILVSLIAATLLAPAAIADWGGRGFLEPDTARDASEGRMWLDPNTGDEKRVYFSAYVVNDDTGLNPNTATTGSSHIAFPFTDFNAILGVWKDCNEDGYIGMQESALIEYRAELLSTDDVCPAGTSDHNDGEWVIELLWIGPDNAAACDDPEVDVVDDNVKNIVDNCARIWGDIGEPEAAGAITCPLTGWSRGTFQSTGGLQRYLDCILTYRMYGALNTIGDASGVDETLGVQIDMHDTTPDRPDRSESIANQPNPYGQPDDDAAVGVWDCSNEPTAVSDPSGGQTKIVVDDQDGAIPRTVEDPSGTFDPVEVADEDGIIFEQNVSDENGILVEQYGVAPSVNPDGSIAGSVNESEEGMSFIDSSLLLPNDEPHDCDRDDNGKADSTTETNGDIYWQLEADFEPSTTTRRDSDVRFGYNEGVSFSDGFDPVPETWADNEALNETVGSSASVGLGTPLRDAVTNDPGWFAQIPYTASRNPFVNIDTFMPQPAQAFTFYAYVDPTVASELGLALPGGVFVYGAEHCDGSAPITGLWDCDPGNWWRGPSGEDIQTVWDAKVQDVYQLRDIDCYDETYLEGQPATYTTVTTETGCAR